MLLSPLSYLSILFSKVLSSSCFNRDCPRSWTLGLLTESLSPPSGTSHSVRKIYAQQIQIRIITKCDKIRARTKPIRTRSEYTGKQFRWRVKESLLWRSDICISIPPPPPSSFNLASFPPLEIFDVSTWILVFKGFPGGAEIKASGCNVGDLGSIPESGRSPGERKGNPFQYSCLENPTDRGAWWATVHRLQRVRHDWATSLSL